MNARVALTAVLSSLALLPSPSEQTNSRADPLRSRYFVPNYATGSPGGGRSGAKFIERSDVDYAGSGWSPSREGLSGLAGGSLPRLNTTGRGTRNFQEDHRRPGEKSPADRRAGGNPPDIKTTVGPSRGDQNQTGCRKNEFHCKSGECLPANVRCDNSFNCSDSSDEVNCVTERIRESGCVLPAQPEGGSYELRGCSNPCNKDSGDNVPRNSILTYTCQDNYILNGSTTPVCVEDEWRNLPSCLKTCPALTSTSVKISCTYHGETVSCKERIIPGTRAALSCKPSYKLSITNGPDYREITCLGNGLWNRQDFRCLPECGVSAPNGNTPIANRFTAKADIFPWHVGIYDKQSNAEYKQICGASLISNNLVVSAAHCFYDEAYKKVGDKSRYAVAAGKRYRDWNANENYAQKSPVAEIFLADRYIGVSGNFAQDISLIKLTTPFELTDSVRPICIDWNNVYEREQLRIGQTGKVIGWGKTIDGEASDELQELNLLFVPYHQCLSTVPDDFRGYITPDKFCAGRLNGSSLCEGDSGGGLCFQRGAKWYLRGIVSVGPAKAGSCEYNSYVGFTYISYFRDWIRDAYLRS